MSRPTMQEVRAAYKGRDAWWTVLLVDPVAGPLVRLVYPYRWITPNVLTLGSLALGLAASACFLAPSYGWVYLGAVLFHASFVLDCMDGKLARLRGSFSVMGSWLDFASDRLQFVLGTFALLGGQYLRTHRPVYLFVMAVVVAVGLLRYVHSAAIDQLEETVRRRTRAAYEAAGQQPPAAAEPAGERVGSAELLSRLGPVGRVKAFLNRHRIRVDVISGIEFEMSVKIIAPLTGLLVVVPMVTAVPLLLFQAFFVYRLWLAVRGLRRVEATLAGQRPAQVPPDAHADPAVAVPADGPAGGSVRRPPAGGAAPGPQRPTLPARPPRG